MQIDRRITNGLAWAGVLLVVGVPTADLLSAQFLGDKPGAPAAQIAVVEERAAAPIPAPASQRPVAKPVEVAAVAPAKVSPVPAPAKPAVPSNNVVDNFVQGGKPLPSYITEAPAQAAAPRPAVAPKPAPAPQPPAPRVAAVPAPAKPQAVQPRPQIATAPAPRVPIQTAPAAAPVGIDPMQTASIPPKVAPTPMPLSMRPRPVAVATANAPVPPATFAPNEPVFVPPSVQPVPPADITAEDLEDWETGPLADFLARREGRQQPRQAEAEPRYSEDEEVFFERGQEFQRRDRLLGPEMFFYQFGN